VPDYYRPRVLDGMRRRCQDCNGTVVRAWHRAIALLALAACAKEARPLRAVLAGEYDDRGGGGGGGGGM